MGHLFQTPAEAAKRLGRPDIMVTAGGVTPAQDYDVLAARARLTSLPARGTIISFFLYKAGVAAIFGLGTPVAYSAKVVMQLLMQESSHQPYMADQRESRLFVMNPKS